MLGLARLKQHVQDQLANPPERLGQKIQGALLGLKQDQIAELVRPKVWRLRRNAEAPNGVQPLGASFEEQGGSLFERRPA